MKRRDLLKFGAGGLAGYFLHDLISKTKRTGKHPVPEIPPVETEIPRHFDYPSIGKIAQDKGYVFGAAAHDYLFEDTVSSDIFSSQCNTLVCEGAMKTNGLRPSADSFRFGRANRYLDYCNRNNIKLRGHTLCWHGSFPNWLKSELQGRQRWQAFEENIRTIASFYKGKLSSWDCVNEATMPSDGRSDGLRNSFLMESLGKEYILRAFQIANDADPTTPLYLCDYFGNTGKARGKKIDATLRLVDWLHEKEAPVSGFGIHGHLVANKPFSDTELYRLLSHIKSAGLDVLVTELDCRDYELSEDIHTRDLEVAAIVNDFISVFEDFSNYRGLVCWGLSDRYSWINKSGVVKPRSDNSIQRVLPFDVNYKPKQMFKVILEHFNRLPKKM